MSTEKNARECFVQEKERDGEEAVKGLTGLARKYYYETGAPKVYSVGEGLYCYLFGTHYSFDSGYTIDAGGPCTLDELQDLFTQWYLAGRESLFCIKKDWQILIVHNDHGKVSFFAVDRGILEDPDGESIDGESVMEFLKGLDLKSISTWERTADACGLFIRADILAEYVMEPERTLVESTRYERMKALTDRIVYVAALNSDSTRGQIKRLADIGFSDKDLLDAGFLEEDVREAMELEEEQELE